MAIPKNGKAILLATFIAFGAPHHLVDSLCNADGILLSLKEASSLLLKMFRVRCKYRLSAYLFLVF